jgi:hypothetical protein
LRIHFVKSITRILLSARSYAFVPLRKVSLGD